MSSASVDPRDCCDEATTNTLVARAATAQAGSTARTTGGRAGTSRPPLAAANATEGSRSHHSSKPTSQVHGLISPVNAACGTSPTRTRCASAPIEREARSAVSASSGENERRPSTITPSVSETRAAPRGARRHAQRSAAAREMWRPVKGLPATLSTPATLARRAAVPALCRPPSGIDQALGAASRAAFACRCSLR